MSDTVLVLGATGRFGRHAAEAFWNAGWSVRIFDRKRDDLVTAALGADVIVNAWNPSYPDWEAEIPLLTEQVIAAAQASGATVLFPGNVYVFGQGSGPLLTTETPHCATNPLGRVRRRMEARYREAGVRTIVLRAGDFIDTERSGNWYEGVIAAKADRGVLTAPGRTDIPHAWAYLPDLARAAVQICAMRERFDTFTEVLFPGYALSLEEVGGILEIALNRRVRLRRFPWWAMFLARPFWPMAGHLREMRYLWDMPHALDDAGFRRLLPDFRATDPRVALSASLQRKANVDPDQPMARGGRHIAAE